jgi:DNA-binding SARP family transcriptional activator
MTAVLHLRLSGACVLERDGVPQPIGKRSSAMLAYLAVEGITARGRMAALLWSEADEERAKQSLRQEVYRVNQFGSIIENDRHNLWLPSSLTNDLGDWNSLEGEFADGLELDEEFEFSQWLFTTREMLRDERLTHLDSEISKLEAKGAYREASSLSRRVIALEPMSEAAHTRFLKLAYLCDDRAAVRTGIAELRRMLREELGVEPLPETLGLLHALETGTYKRAQRQNAQPSIPLSVLRPPRLVGGAWSVAQSGITKGRAVFVVGDAGIGKTRLLHELAASRSALGGRILEIHCRETEQNLAYSSLTQAVRDSLIFAQPTVPDLWKLELSRLIPEFKQSVNLMAALSSSAELLEARLRLLEAFTQYALALAAPGGLIVADDLHWADSATLEWLAYAAPRLLKQGVGLLCSYRPLEASVPLRDLVTRLEAEGVASRMPLEPLREPEVAELLSSIDPRAATLSLELHRATEGNPLFIIETLKSLLETGQLSADWQLSGTLHMPERINALLRQRLERLSGNTQRTLGALALLGINDLGGASSSGGPLTNSAPSLIADVLEGRELEVAEALFEAQNARVILENGAFTHDLLRQTALALMPPPVQRALHHRAAIILEARGVDPLRVAAHHEAANDPRRAAPFLIQAAERALERLEPALALEHLQNPLALKLEESLQRKALEVRQRALEALEQPLV